MLWVAETANTGRTLIYIVNPYLPSIGFRDEFLLGSKYAGVLTCEPFRAKVEVYVLALDFWVCLCENRGDC